MAQFHVGYYLFAILFLMFDVDTVFLFPWASIAKTIGSTALLAVGTIASTVMINSVQKARLVTDREQIEEYIADTFGEQYLAGAGIKEYSEDEEIFEVHVGSHTYMVRRAQFGGFDWHEGCYEDYGED